MPEPMPADNRVQAGAAGVPDERAALHALRCEQAAAHAAAARALGRRSRLDGGLRLVSFAAAAVFTARAATQGGGLYGGLALAAWLAFVALVLEHGRVQAALRRARGRTALAEESAARIAGQRRGPGAGGTIAATTGSDLEAGRAVHAPEPAAHALSDWAVEDLGIAGGSPSLFELFDTTQSTIGARRLRFMMSHPLLDPGAIRARQGCVQELAGARAVRDELLLAFWGGRGEDQARVPALLASPPLLRRGAWSLAALACGVACIPSLLLAYSIPACRPLALASLAGVSVIRLATRKRTALLRDAYLELEPLVGRARAVARVLAGCRPASPALAALADVCGAYEAPGIPWGLRAVAWRLRALHLHELGFLGSILQLLTLWDVHWLVGLEARVKHPAGRYERLASALADLEAQTALAVYADEQARVVFPEILAEGEPQLAIASGEHPLLGSERAVGNDVDLGGATRLAIVTGSNMAGKSTYLRMTALAVVAAQIGAPVRARAMRLTPLALYANINVRDSLADGKSYFLVEVERVQEILRAASRTRALLGIFDELFRGTNAHERLAASREIARHLAGTGALFLLATHDQGLGRLGEEEAVDGVTALHFEDEIVAGEMRFPYRVRPGVARTHNAIRLLEISGYPAEVVSRARARAEAAFGVPSERASGFREGDSGGGSTRVADTPAV